MTPSTSQLYITLHGVRFEIAVDLDHCARLAARATQSAGRKAAAGPVIVRPAKDAVIQVTVTLQVKNEATWSWETLEAITLRRRRQSKAALTREALACCSGAQQERWAAVLPHRRRVQIAWAPEGVASA